MAWAHAELTVTETTRLAADLPMIAVNNQAASYNTPAVWRTSGSWASGSSATYTNVISYATSRLWDGLADPRSRGNGIGGGTLTYLLLDLANVTFDTIALISHDFDAAGTTAVAVQIADDNAFTSNLQTIAQWSSAPWLGGNTRRLVDVTLGGGLHVGVVVGARYSNVRWMRIQFTTTSEPSIGELFLGQRFTLPHRPEFSDEIVLDGETDTAESEAGLIQGVERWAGRLNVAPNFVPDSQTYEDIFRDAFEGMNYGTAPFLYLPNPSSNVRAAYLCRTEPAMGVIPTGPYARSVKLPLVEQAPFVARET